MCAFYTAGLVEMLKTVDSQHAGFPDLWDLKAQEMANIVENMFIQSPHYNMLRTCSSKTHTAVYFPHRTRIPPEQFFPGENGNGGLNLDNAWEGYFLGPRLSWSHAGKAAYYAT